MNVLRKTCFSGAIKDLSLLKSRKYCLILPKDTKEYFNHDFNVSCKAYSHNNKYVSSFTDFDKTNILYAVIESNGKTIDSFNVICDMKEMKEKHIDVKNVLNKNDDFSLTMVKLYNIHLYNVIRLIKKEKKYAYNR